MLRLKQLRESKGLNMKEAARILEMPYTTYVNYEKGLREPTSEVLIQFANFYNTTVDFIVGRDPNVFNHKEYEQYLSEKNSSNKSSQSFRVSIEEQNLIEQFRVLDERGQAAVLAILQHEYDNADDYKTSEYEQGYEDGCEQALDDLRHTPYDWDDTDYLK